jgi:DNA mismatch repair protein MSH5
MVSNRTVVNPNVDDELDAIKREWDGLGDLLDHVRIAMEPRVPSSLGYTLNVLYFPQIGFLIAVGRTIGTESGSEPAEPPEGWERIFATGYLKSNFTTKSSLISTRESTYYKSDEMTELDERYGDMWTAICGMLISSNRR